MQGEIIISVIGSAGVPARYGGFETLAEQLVVQNQKNFYFKDFIVYCQKIKSKEQQATYLGAKLRYLPLRANGAQSVLYDGISILDSCFSGSNALLVLGVSGAYVFPVVRLLFPKVKIIVNIDGIEWKRDKWTGIARSALRLFERLAVRYSHVVIADNQAISEYVKQRYDRYPQVISYGGDHALTNESGEKPFIYSSKPSYALTVCRIEPENNVDMILEAFSRNSGVNLVVVGNWSASRYGRNLRLKYSKYSNLTLSDPVYDKYLLEDLRRNCRFYVHGHSAGGTNPSLVEIMHFRKAVFAFDCIYNRYTTQGRSIYFNTSDELIRKINDTPNEDLNKIACELFEIANSCYLWGKIGKQYAELIKSIFK